MAGWQVDTLTHGPTYPRTGLPAWLLKADMSDLTGKTTGERPDTIRFNGYARDMLLTLAAAPPTGLRHDVSALCDRVGVWP